MKFGPTPLDAAEGTILAHSLRLEGRVLKKGRVLDAADCAALRQAGTSEVIAARIEPGDIGEDAAATAIASAAAGQGLRVATATTGRCNLHADVDGLLRVDAGAVEDANRVDEALTLATPPDFARLSAGQLAATAKVIPYGASRVSLGLVQARLTRGGPALRLCPFRPLRVALLLTQAEGAKASVMHKGSEAVRNRVDSLGSSLVFERITPHATQPLADAIREAQEIGPDLILILAGSATSDRLDTAPSAIVVAGGLIERFGMPVDPGNLLVLARLGEIPAIVLPGCARSPALNGADWVLERIAAGLTVSPHDIAAMGVGGLLKEIPSRPQPREARPK